MRKIYILMMGAIMAMTAKAQQSVVTFEEVELNADLIYNGADEEGGFSLGGFTFNNNYFAEWSYWSGVGVSGRTETSFSSYLLDQFNSAVGHGVNGSEKYAVVYPQGETIDVDDEAGAVINGMYVTNNAWAVDAILHGDGYAGTDPNGNSYAADEGFRTGDFFLLQVIGLHADETADTIDVYLADFRSENEAEHFYLNDWKYVDLTPLGTVTAITFRMDSSRGNSWGMTTPGYFCMDNFNDTQAAEGDLVVATFEDLGLEAESCWKGDAEAVYSSFKSGSFEFSNGFMADYDYWFDFAYASYTANTFATLADQFNTAPGGGHESATYCVSFPQGGSITVTNRPEGDVVKGMYVTNNAYAYTSMTNGDAYSKKFGQGDWFKLTVTGLDAQGEKTGTVDFYLADLRSENEADHYILNTWEWCDLSSLGTVKQLTFVLNSTDVGDWGMNTPGYFCMDNLGAEGTSSIHTAQRGSTQAVEVARYDMQGHLLAAPTKGVNIVRMSDGTARKVVVR